MFFINVSSIQVASGYEPSKNYDLKASTFLVKLENSSRQECNMTCQLIPECIAFSFNDKTRLCTAYPNIPITYTTSDDFYAAFKVSSGELSI